jgi:hypothetical protein
MKMPKVIYYMYDAALGIWNGVSNPRDQWGYKQSPDHDNPFLAICSLVGAFCGMIAGAYGGWWSGGYVGIPVGSLIGSVVSFFVLGLVFYIPVYILQLIIKIGQSIAEQPREALSIVSGVVGMATILGLIVLAIWAVYYFWGVGAPR